MRSMRWVRCAGLLVCALVFTGAQQDQGWGPQVLHAEVPDCVLAFRARLTGQVLIRVTIDKQGKVTSSAVEHSLYFATPCTEAAAQKWTFAPSDRDETREALLSFLFTDERQKTEAPGHTLWSFDGPWTMLLGYAESTVGWLPRENGRVPEKRCPVHGEVMSVEVVGAEYGLLPMRSVDPENPEGTPEERRREADFEDYVNARETLFPEANRFVRGGCIVHEPKQEVYYCQACRDAEKEWLASHPGFDPEQ